MKWRDLFKTRRERQLEELVAIYKGNVSELLKRPAYVQVQVPDEADQTAYLQALARLETDDLLKYHFVRMRDEVVKAFLFQGKDYAEFFRGKLSAIDEIITDGRNAHRQIAQMPVIESKDEV